MPLDWQQFFTMTNSITSTLLNSACSVRLALLRVSALAFIPGDALADAIFEHSGHTYKIITEPASWSDASNIAGEMTLGGHSGYLARVDSARENAAILKAITDYLSPEQIEDSLAEDGSEAPFIWLGGSDSIEEGTWVWSNNGDAFWLGDFNGTGVEGRFTNWGVQPDSATGAEDGLAMGLAEWPAPFYDLGSSGQWNDLDTSTQLMYVVEFDGKSDLRIAIEEPVQGGMHSGIGMIRGWAVSSADIARIEVYVDGEFVFDVPHGGLRRDVGNIFADIQGSSESGYASAVNFNGLTKGDHKLTVRATDSFGSVKERTVEFGVTRFNKSFISEDEYIELGWAGFSALGRSISVRGARIGDEYYDISLEWRSASQNFEITSIRQR